MKRFLPLAFLLVATPVLAQQLPSPSPSGKVEQTVGLTQVTITYNRPSMRDRVIFGDLVPYDAVWRTGANKCTTFEVDGPVKVEGQDLPAGKYSIFTIPGKESWVVIFNKNTELWGEGDRKEEEDVLTIKVPAGQSGSTETFTITMDHVKDDQASVQMRWERTMASFTVQADATERALANIKEALSKPDADFRAYTSSARFCLDRGIMTADALQWAQKSVEQEKRFWNVHTLALAQAANGKYAEAIVTAEESKRMAQEEKYEAYVKMNDEKIAEWRTKAQSGARTR